MAERGGELQLRTALETVQNNREVLALFASIEDQLRVCPFIGETHQLTYAWNDNRLDCRSSLERSCSNALKYASSLEESVARVLDAGTTAEQKSNALASILHHAQDIETISLDDVSRSITAFPAKVAQEGKESFRLRLVCMMRGIIDSTYVTLQRLTKWRKDPSSSSGSLEKPGPPARLSYHDRHPSLERTVKGIQTDCGKLSGNLIAYSSFWRAVHVACDELASASAMIVQQPKDDSSPSRVDGEVVRGLKDELVWALRAYVDSFKAS